MVTSRQVARGVVRTMRAMDRSAKQAERRRVAFQKAVQREAMLDASAQAAREFDEIIEALTGAHRKPPSLVNWTSTASKSEAPVPERTSATEDAARRKAADYQPGWVTRVLKREARARQALEDAVAAARAADDQAHVARKREVEDHNASIRFARRVMALEPDAMVEALEQHSSLDDLPFSVEGLDTLFMDGRVVAVVEGLDLEDIPDQSVSLLKSGKASVKAIPIGRRHELHREAICSAAVRVALEYLAILPLEEIEVVMLADLLDRASGHILAQPVLYLRTTKQALKTVNLERAEAGALVERLGGHFEWTKRDGFRAINPAAFGIELP